MKQPYVVDTNVGVVANEKWPGASAQCVFNCVRRLREFQEIYRVVLDSSNLILEEYRRNLSLAGKGPKNNNRYTLVVLWLIE